MAGFWNREIRFPGQTAFSGAVPTSEPVQAIARRREVILRAAVASSTQD